MKISTIDVEIDGSAYTQLFATSNDFVLGVADVQHIDKQTASVRRLFVDPRVRRQGVGHGLLARCEKIASQSSCSTIALQVDAENVPNVLPFYEKHGYFIAWQYPRRSPSL
jgi:GNAT superfamily N-acetyltransferase